MLIIECFSAVEFLRPSRNRGGGRVFLRPFATGLKDHVSLGSSVDDGRKGKITGTSTFWIDTQVRELYFRLLNVTIKDGWVCSRSVGRTVIPASVGFIDSAGGKHLELPRCE